MTSMVPEDAPKPRLCHLNKTDDFIGYGFNLHAEKGKAGQYIGKVDPGSPAEKAKLKEGDRIVEVNGTNIGNENHQQVVQRIKAVPDETKLLVVDKETDEYYKSKKIVIRGDMPNVLLYSNVDISTPNEDIAVTDYLKDGIPISQVSSEESASDPKPRLCHLKIWSSFQGYGFNLHAEKGKPGQFIGNVDPNSPAELAGLQEGDRIVEVNGENVGRDNHGEVVKKIKSDPTQTRLLVVDAEAEKFYKERDMTVTSSQSNVVTVVCPDSQPAGNGSENQVKAEVNHVTLVSNTDQEASAEVQGEYANVMNESAPQHVKQEEEDELIDKPGFDVKVNQVNGQPQTEETAEAITESIREMEQAVADESIEHEDEKQEYNNNTDMAEDYDIIANIPKSTDKETQEARLLIPDPAHVPTPDPVVVPTSETEKPAIPEVEKQKTAPAESNVTISGIGFANSAKEAREKMSKKRRDEVKLQQLSAKDKYNMYMKL